MVINISAGGWSVQNKPPIIKEKGELMRHFSLNYGRNKIKFNIKELVNAAFIQRATALAAMICVTVLSVVTVMAKTHTAHVIYDGKKTDVEMASSATSDILLKAGVKTTPEDVIVRKDDSDNAGDVIITVKSTCNVKVLADGKEISAAAHYGDTVGDALESAGVSVDCNDIVTPSAESNVTNGMQISVKRCYNISIEADGRTVNAVVGEGNVASAIKETGFAIGGNDTVNADLSSKITDGQKLEITRVAYKEIVTTEPLAYKTVTKKSKALSSGQIKVETAGQNGVKTIVTKQKFINGKPADSTVVSTAVTQEPVNKVVEVGAKSAIASVGSDGTLTDQNGNKVSYKRVLSGRCSCYCTGTTTSTGLKAAYGRVAVNPNIIPYGTRLYICSPDGRLVYGYAVAADTGGAAMKGSIIADLYYSSYSQCMKIGSRTMNVYIL